MAFADEDVRGPNMALFELGYRKWQGKLGFRIFRWMPMVRRQIPVLLRSKVLITLLVLFLLFTMISQAITLAGLMMGNALMSTYTVAQYIDIGLYFTYVILVFAGAGLISSDIRANAFQIYGSKPITWLDYYKGKFVTVGLFIFATTFVPGTVFYLFGIGSQVEMPGWQDVMKGVGFVFLYSMLLVVTLSTIILFLSSITKNQWVAGVLWILILLMGNTIGELVEEVSDTPGGRYFSVEYNLRCVAARMLEETRIDNVSFLAPESIFPDLDRELPRKSTTLAPTGAEPDDPKAFIYVSLRSLATGPLVGMFAQGRAMNQREAERLLSEEEKQDERDQNALRMEMAKLFMNSGYKPTVEQLLGIIELRLSLEQKPDSDVRKMDFETSLYVTIGVTLGCFVLTILKLRRAILER
ncbi:MAG: hypothetical protein NUW37_00430 [Planctomycetes bacterium]|nr:hypothetical protein [Planctomycetota bacterium]